MRDETAREFTNSKDRVDDIMADLHEVRVRRAEKKYDLKKLAEKAESKGKDANMLCSIKCEVML